MSLAPQHLRLAATSSRAPRAKALAALDSLPRLDCAVLGLLLVERLSLTETAQVLALPVSTVRRRYEAALTRLRRALSPLLAQPRTLRRPARPTTALRKAS